MNTRDLKTIDKKVLDQIEKFMMEETKLESGDLPRTGKTVGFVKDIVDKIKVDVEKNKDEVVKEFENKLQYARAFDALIEEDINPKVVAFQFLFMDILNLR